MPVHQPGGNGGTTSERFEYFMIRLTRSDGDPDRVAGLVERLGTGEKRSFDTGDQLIQVVGGWSAPNLNLQPATGHSNAGHPRSTNSSLGDGA